MWRTIVRDDTRRLVQEGRSEGVQVVGDKSRSGEVWRVEVRQDLDKDFIREGAHDGHDGLRWMDG